MDDKMLFEGFDPKKQAGYEAELVERYGDEAVRRIADAKAGMKDWGKKDWSQFQEEAKAIEHDLAKALTQGLPVDSQPVTAIMRRHWAWIGRSWNREPTPDAFAGLAHLYEDNPEFTARYEAIAPGLTAYFAEAMRVFARAR